MLGMGQQLLYSTGNIDFLDPARKTTRPEREDVEDLVLHGVFTKSILEAWSVWDGRVSYHEGEDRECFGRLSIK
jgi:hypothetical protein